uniref:MYB transcription factor n=1 Tax=Gentiana triflora TaxID=55190 RepID=W6JM39_GENTR|nr:MYB transcription factor [Gentiana triflora]
MRKPWCYENRGACSKEKDENLTKYSKKHSNIGRRCYHLPQTAGFHRCGKRCRVKGGNNFDEDEEDLFIKLHALLGNRWSLIAGRLPGRTEKEVKKYWNSHLKRKLISMGIDPNNHHPPPHAAASPSPGLGYNYYYGTTTTTCTPYNNGEGNNIHHAKSESSSNNIINVSYGDGDGDGEGEGEGETS